MLADFARGVQTAARAKAAAIERMDRTGNVPLSFAQQRLWLLEQPGSLGSIRPECETPPLFRAAAPP